MIIQLPCYSMPLSHAHLSGIHFLLVYCPLLGAKFCHTCSLALKERPFRLIKSLVLDSTVLRERHKISIGRPLLAWSFSNPQQMFYSKVKTLRRQNNLILIAVGRVNFNNQLWNTNCSCVALLWLSKLLRMFLRMVFLTWDHVNRDVNMPVVWCILNGSRAQGLLYWIKETVSANQLWAGTCQWNSEKLMKN